VVEADRVVEAVMIQIYPTPSAGSQFACEVLCTTHAAGFAMTATPSNLHIKAIIMLLLTNLLWGVSFPLVKALALLHAQIVPTAGTWFSTFYTVAPRFVLAALILAFLQGRNCWRFTRPELWQGMILGLFSAAGMLLQNDGLQFIAASTSAFLSQLYAIMIPVGLALYHRRNPGARVWVSCGFVIVGVAMIGRFDWQSFTFGRGEAETLLASFFYMGQILCLGWARFAGNRAGKITLVMFSVQALIFSGLAGGAAPDMATLVLPWTSLPWFTLTLVLTVLCTVGAFSLMNAWQPKISSTEAGLIYCVEPIFASVMAMFMPAWFSIWAGINYANETATWTLLFGGVLITGANVFIQLRPPKLVLGQLT
jgi:drug/metabolite transporter (DMT)-like permease